MNGAVRSMDPTTGRWCDEYDGHLTLGGQKTDAILVEASEPSAGVVFVFAQRYEAKGEGKPVQRVGKPAILYSVSPRLV